MVAGDDIKGEARIRLNVLLREVVLATQRSCEQADLFQTSVPVDEITDYHQFVDPSHATVCLEQVLSRTRSCFYTSIPEFRREYEQILANALAYNSPGHGRHAYKPIIGWAQDLLDLCRLELHAHRSELAAAEKKLKDALDADECHFKSDASDDSSGPLSCLEALVAACELAAEQEGLEEEEPHYLDDVMAEDADQAEPTDLKPEPVAEQLAVPKRVSQGPATAQAKRASQGASGLHRAASAPAKTGAYESAPKYRRHKSKVYIRPNKVVYLPTTFMEENFDPCSLPVNCEMIVETNGHVQPDRHMVTIKSVPRQGLSTMYCMTNVMKFQQQFLNWQILNWTKVDGGHIQIHLQGPNGTGKGSKADPEEQASGAHGKAGSESHKRKSNGNIGKEAYQAASAFEDGDDDEEADEECRERVAAAAQPARIHRQASRSASDRRQSRLSSGALSQAVRQVEQQHEGFAAQQGSGSSSPSHHAHLLQPADDDGRRSSPANSSDAMDLPRGLDIAQLQFPPAAYSNSYPLALPIWGLQNGASLSSAAALDDALMQGYDEQQHHIPMPPYHLGCSSLPGSSKPTPLGVMMMQQLASSSNSSIISGFNPVLMPGPGTAMAADEMSPSALKRHKADAGSSAFMGGMPGAPGGGISLHHLIMSDHGAVAAALASLNGSANVEASEVKRSFDGSTVTTEAPYASTQSFGCNMQQACST